MPYVKLTDAQTAYKAGIGQDLLRGFRDNQEDHESRIMQLLAQSQNAIVDDFFTGSDTASGSSSWVDAALYDSSASGGTTLINLTEIDGSHVFQMQSVAVAGTMILSPVKGRCRLRFNQDMAAFLEFRVKEPGATVMNNIFYGLQNRASADPSVETNCIAFLKGTTAGKWRFRVASGGVQTETDNIGNRATWQKLRMELLRSGGGATLQVKAFIDGAEISGSPFTTNIPTGVVLKPFMSSISPAAGTTDLRTDRWEIRWTAVPVAA